MAEDPRSVSDILDKLERLADQQSRVSLEDAVAAFGNRSYGPFLLVPALIEISPIGGIPGLPTVLAAIIILFAVQMLIGRQHLWLPHVIGKRAAAAGTVHRATAKLRGVASMADRWFHGRLPALTQGPFVRLAALATIALALTVPPLELLPFASTAPMAAIAAFGLALLVRDGALMIAAILLAGVAVAVGIGLIGSR